MGKKYYVSLHLAGNYFGLSDISFAGLALRNAVHKKLACIQATEGLVHKCHSICVLSTGQYELNTKHFLTLLSTVLVKACSVCGLLFLLVIQCEPPALLRLTSIYAVLEVEVKFDKELDETL